MVAAHPWTLAAFPTVFPGTVFPGALTRYGAGDMVRSA
jgi:hypothetical protein